MAIIVLRMKERCEGQRSQAESDSFLTPDPSPLTPPKNILKFVLFNRTFAPAFQEEVHLFKKSDSSYQNVIY